MHPAKGSGEFFLVKWLAPPAGGALRNSFELHASIANDRVFGVRAIAPSMCAFVISNDRVWYDVKRDHGDLRSMIRDSAHMGFGLIFLFFPPQIRNSSL